MENGRLNMKENIYFSQHGQDFIVDNLIKEPKVIIEVGCVDGLVNSNSFFFEKNYDTSCYLFEPHTKYSKQIPKNRPKSVFYQYAISNKDDDNGIFYENIVGTFSNLSNKFRDRYEHSNLFHGYKKIENIKIRKLDTCLKNLKITKIDFLSIDVDGNDIFVLEGINLFKYKPRILVIEMNDTLSDFKKYIKHIKKSSDYRYFLVLKQDLFVFLNYSDFIKTLFTIKSIKLFNHGYELGLKTKSKTKIIKINGLLMLHDYIKLKNLEYRKLFYRLNKIRKLIQNLI